MSSGVGRRRSSDLALLWLWCRPAATALIQPQAWESPHATGAALKRQKKKKKKKGILTHATAWMNLKDIILGDISQLQDDKYCMIPLK